LSNNFFKIYNPDSYTKLENISTEMSVLCVKIKQKLDVFFTDQIELMELFEQNINIFRCDKEFIISIEKSILTIFEQLLSRNLDIHSG